MKIKKIFITGISGLLGCAMARQYQDEYKVVGTYYSNKIYIDRVKTVGIDLNNYEETKSLITHENPDLIIHTAALANVDLCEKNPEIAKRLNVDQAVNIAHIAKGISSKLVFISTDQLFGGTKPLRREDDKLNPINEYAKTKAVAEKEIQNLYSNNSLIVRTNFFGNGLSQKASFSDWALKKIKNNESQNYFTNIYYTPILMSLLNQYIMDLVKLDEVGIYNICGSERINKYDFVVKLAEVFGLSQDSIIKKEYVIGDLTADRPTDLSISCVKLEQKLGIKVPTTEEQIKILNKENE